jgi:ribosome-binding factor A
MPTQRQLRVGEEIRHALASLFQRGDVPWPEGKAAPMVTVTEVQVSPDLRNAFAFVTPLGGNGAEALAKELNAIAGYFRHEIGRAVKLRYVPALRFKADTTFDYADRIETILNDPTVARDIAKGKKKESPAAFPESDDDSDGDDGAL